MENLSTHQYTIENKTNYAFITNVNTGKVFSVAKNIAKIEKIGTNQVAILHIGSLKPIVVFEYQNLLSPASTDIDNLIETVLGAYFFSSAGGGSGTSVSPGSTNFSTLYWNDSAQEWQESVQLLSNPNSTITLSNFNIGGSNYACGFYIDNFQWRNILSDNSGTKTISIGYSESLNANLENRRIDITQTELRIGSYVDNTDGFQILMQDDLFTVRQIDNNGTFSIKDVSADDLVSDDTDMFPTILSSRNSFIAQSAYNSAIIGGDSVQVDFPNTLGFGGLVVKHDTLLADTVLTGTEGVLVYSCDPSLSVSGITIDLPTNPEIGRVYIFKDTGNASNIQPVVIDPVVGSIDGQSVYTITVPNTSITIIHVGGNAWRII